MAAKNQLCTVRRATGRFGGKRNLEEMRASVIAPFSPQSFGFGSSLSLIWHHQCVRRLYEDFGHKNDTYTERSCHAFCGSSNTSRRRLGSTTLISRDQECRNLAFEWRELGASFSRHAFALGKRSDGLSGIDRGGKQIGRARRVSIEGGSVVFREPFSLPLSARSRPRGSYRDILRFTPANSPRPLFGAERLPVY
jgi:hypothetical protein